MMLRSLRCQPRAVLLRGVRSQLAAFSDSASSAVQEEAAVAEKKKKAPQQQPVVETTWNTLVVGEIVEFHPHPQADRLNICAVNVGDKENLLQIICGASNVRQGARVPVAKVGTRLAIKEPETGELYVEYPYPHGRLAVVAVVSHTDVRCLLLWLAGRSSRSRSPSCAERSRRA